MSATDELRRMLDERGVKYKRHYLNTSWYVGMKLYMATDDVDSTLTVDNLMPEQAIVATLGNSRAERTCEFSIKDNMNETEGMGDVWIECSACNCVFDYYADEWLMKMSYCPNCGARRVGE